MEKQAKKRRFGDRHDAVRLRDMDSYHIILPYIYPHRADCEASFTQKVDMTNILAYLKERNARPGAYKTTMFQIFIAAFAKTCILRPKLNNYIIGKHYFRRTDFKVGFVAKAEFSDEGEEFLVNMTLCPEDTLDSYQSKLQDRISKAKQGNEGDSTTDAMNVVTKLPRFLLSLLIRIFRILEYFNIMPQSLVSGDPDYSTVFVTNLGSIKCGSGYHHLNNWGTNSIFCALGLMQKEPVFQADGSYEMRDIADTTFVVDERIADGFYFIKSIQLFKYILAHPQILERPFGEPIEMENA